MAMSLLGTRELTGLTVRSDELTISPPGISLRRRYVQGTRFAMPQAMPVRAVRVAKLCPQGYTPVARARETRLWHLRATLRYQRWTHH